MSKFKDGFIRLGKRIFEFLSKMIALIRVCLSAILGNFSYRPPEWWRQFQEPTSELSLRFQASKTKTIAWLSRHKKILCVSLGIVFIGLGAWGGWEYYLQTRPQPKLTSFAVHKPRPMDYSQTNPKPNPLRIVFFGSVADFKLVGKKIEKGVSLNPEIKGSWKFENDKVLTFEPESEWPIGQKITFLLENTLFADSVTLSKYSETFETDRFSVSLADSEFNQHPTIPKEKKGIVSLKFNYPVDPVSLSNSVSAELVDDMKSSKDVRFTIHYGQNLTSAYIHSEFLAIPKRDSVLKVVVNKGVKSSLGGSASDVTTTANITVPGMYNYFKISDISTEVIRNEKFEPEQVLIITTTAAARSADVAKNLTFSLLPKIKSIPNYDSEVWNSPGEVTSKIREDLEPIEWELIPSEFENSQMHSFRFKAPVSRYGLVTVSKGVKSFGDYVLADTYEEIIKIPKFSKELLIMHNGSILSLRGEKKIPILSRNIKGIKYSVRRLRPNDLHHLITQTSGRFQDPSFINSWNFSESNVAETFSAEEEIADSGPSKTNYSSFDFSKYLNSSVAGGPRGVFFFSTSDWNPQTKQSGGVSSERFIVLTDLGIISKTSVNGDTDVYVQSFSSGRPVVGASVEVLTINGNSLYKETTNSQGHVRFPSFKAFEREKKPIAIIAKIDNDYTFLPLGKRDRSLDFQRFDIGGLESSSDSDKIQAFVFSDRGIYRPGDSSHFGVVVKNLSWKALPTGMPLEFSISNPKGVEVLKKRFTVAGDGVEEFTFDTSEDSPTGSYNAQVFLIRDGVRSTTLGSETIKIEEFLPDRMKILTTLSQDNLQGWIKTDQIKAKVLLTNLFGTPAQNRKIISEFRLVPAFPSTRIYPDFHFLNPKHSEQSYIENLETVQTNNAGEAELHIDLRKFAASSYRLEFVAEGFEAEGGRSVSSSSSVFLSPLDYVIGYKTDGDLNYMRTDTKRKIEFIAIDKDMKKTSSKDMKANLMEVKYVSVLTKQPNGSYKYQSSRKEIPVGDGEKIEISNKGLIKELDTTRGGNFVLVIVDKDGLEYAKIPYSVIGNTGLARGLDRNAELQIILDKSDYAKGGEIELQIKAPYTGAGLITIERGSVFASKWFKTDSETSIQKIKIPDELEGNAYVSIVFLRALDSKEIYTSPLSYAVSPFTISKNSRKTDISLKAPTTVRPGEKIDIKYSASRPTSIIVYGADEGILQVASYKLPDPLSFFFTKRSLQVQTSQILDLLLPEYSITKELSAVGGDEDTQGHSLNLNPFKRRRDKPVAFWSGILKADSVERVFSYEVPDYFNGSLKIMTVAMSEEAVGSESMNAIVRGDFILSPNIPTFVAPGDEFEISVGVSNTAVGSKQADNIKLSLQLSDELEVLSSANKVLNIEEGSEKSETFKIKAKNKLGSASLKFLIEWNGKKAQSTTSLSVRPAIPFMTDLKMGMISSSSEKIDVSRKMYDEYRQLSVGASILPMTFAQALMNYLEQYPYGCTEQVVSKGFPTLVLSTLKGFEFDSKIVEKSYASVISTLRKRQSSTGGFGLWSTTPSSFDFHSLYAIHYLTESKARGFREGDDLLNRGIDYLKSRTYEKADDLHEARLWAYSLYLQARNDFVPKRSLEELRSILDHKFANKWKNDLTGVYMAGTYALIQKSDEGEKIIRAYKSSEKGEYHWNFFYDKSIRETQYLYIAGNHFPDELKDLKSEDFFAMLEPLTRGTYTTTNSSYAILGLDAFIRAQGHHGQPINNVEVSEIFKDGENKLQLKGGLFPESDFSQKAEKIKISKKGKFNIFYQTTQAGFDLNLPKKTVQEGMEIERSYLDREMKPISSLKMGDEIWVRLRSRTILDTGDVDNIVIVDLLPGGFEVVRDVIRETTSSRHFNNTFKTNYVDIREDRVLVFGDLNSSMNEYYYKIKATNIGSYVVPPPFAESMYDRSVKARGLASTITVTP